MGDNAVTLRPTDTVTETPEPITSEVTETLEIENEPEIAEHVEAIDETSDTKSLDSRLKTERDTSLVADRLAQIRAANGRSAVSMAADNFSSTYSEDQHAEDIAEYSAINIAAHLTDDHQNTNLALGSPELNSTNTNPETPTAAESKCVAKADDDSLRLSAADPAPIARASVARVLKSAKGNATTQPLACNHISDDVTIPPQNKAEMLATLAQTEAETAKRLSQNLPASAVNNALDLERLFNATESRLEGAEVSRIHANISHLKAAVAARAADIPMTSTETGNNNQVYREDLANAVKATKRRANQTENPTTQAAPPEPNSPLVLVSEQRIYHAMSGDPEIIRTDYGVNNSQEFSPSSQVTPVPHTTQMCERIQPRRVRRAMIDSIESDGDVLASVTDSARRGWVDSAKQEPNFVEFAAELGAKELADILEAAAAYSQLVQGRESFSRPKLLHLAMEADETFSREEGLRSFGQLLRNGTIKKLNRGLFELARTSRYAEPAAKRSAS
ncbi:hypothetical protein OIU14_10240 [Thalassobacter stenotrophicus]|uniref:hypothetical protein n=1 Tax=Thalassobacter stenotrophicus TaxID=266809 RepID=UPI0022A95381|nr:hypothetical protein [Thalassobacter stenotrophicus]UYP66875.1 hypothetical protein OIU14_10240 [Thalassobacter stenotrophicus]